MKKAVFVLILLLFFTSCEKVRQKKTSKRVIYSTKYCKKGKKLWAKSFLGKKAPEFTVEGWLGAKPNLKGKFVIMDFWATHCPQCRRAIPELNKIAKELKDKVVVIGISSESESVIKSMKEPVIEYYSAYDTRAVLKRKFQVRGIPHIVVVAPDGKVVWEGYPFLGSDRFTLEKMKQIIK